MADTIKIGDVITLDDLIENMEMEGTVVASITEDNETHYFVSVGILGNVIKVDGEGSPI